MPFIAGPAVLPCHPGKALGHEWLGTSRAPASVPDSSQAELNIITIWILVDSDDKTPTGLGISTIYIV